MKEVFVHEKIKYCLRDILYWIRWTDIDKTGHYNDFDSHDQFIGTRTKLIRVIMHSTEPSI